MQGRDFKIERDRFYENEFVFPKAKGFGYVSQTLYEEWGRKKGGYPSFLSSSRFLI